MQYRISNLQPTSSDARIVHPAVYSHLIPSMYGTQIILLFEMSEREIDNDGQYISYNAIGMTFIVCCFFFFRPMEKTDFNESV